MRALRRGGMLLAVPRVRLALLRQRARCVRGAGACAPPQLGGGARRGEQDGEEEEERAGEGKCKRAVVRASSALAESALGAPRPS
jgi:hypothetical protein